MRWWKETATACAYVGTVVGAGFASGQELVQFFLILGPRALSAALLATGLFSTAGFVLRSLACRWETSSYKELARIILGPTERLADGVLTAFLFSSVVVMLAGAGAVTREHLGFSAWWGSGLAAGLTMLAVVARSRGVLYLNIILVPGLVVCLAGIAAYNFHLGPPQPVPIRSPFLISHWVLNSFLYVTYNMIQPAVLFATLPPQEGGKRGALVGGMVVGALLLLLVGALGGLPHEDLERTVPVLALVERLPSVWKTVYVWNLWVAMVTTAVTGTYALVERLLAARHFCPAGACAVVIGPALPLSGLGFGRLVGCTYPLFGYLVLFILAGSGLRACLEKLKRCR